MQFVRLQSNRAAKQIAEFISKVIFYFLCYRFYKMEIKKYSNTKRSLKLFYLTIILSFG